MKNKIVTIMIISATVILAGIAIFTAIRLYQQRQQSVVPTEPESIPQAQELPPVGGEDVPDTPGCTDLSFTIGTPSPTPTATSTSSPTPTATATATATSTPTSPPGNGGDEPTPTPASCNNSCSVTSDCESGLSCVNSLCRNPSCTEKTNCVCDVVVRVTATPKAALPSAGVGTPTVLGVSAGAILLIVSLALIL